MNNKTSSAFAVDKRIDIKIDLELAIALGRLILETDTPNTALLALGHNLRSLQNATHTVPPEAGSNARPG